METWQKNHEKEDAIKNVDHAKYFTQSLLYQDACDGILDRERDIALERTAAVMWGFDPMQMGQELTYIEQDDEFDVMELSKVCFASDFYLGLLISYAMQHCRKFTARGRYGQITQSEHREERWQRST